MLTQQRVQKEPAHTREGVIGGVGQKDKGKSLNHCRALPNPNSDQLRAGLPQLGGYSVLDLVLRSESLQLRDFLPLMVIQIQHTLRTMSKESLAV